MFLVSTRILIQRAILSRSEIIAGLVIEMEKKNNKNPVSLEPKLNLSFVAKMKNHNSSG